MLRSAENISGFEIHATDGEIGKITDLYFDDRTWTIRYFVVQTGHWLTSRKVLLSPSSVDSLNWVSRKVSVSLTQLQVQESPDIDTDKPVARQHEIALANYFGWPVYWEEPCVTWPSPLESETHTPPPPDDDKGKVDPHLRSLKEVVGYYINAADGKVGHVEDMLVSDGTWVIRYVVVDTKNWLPGRRVLISPLWVQEVSWPLRSVSVDLMRQTIRKAPLYEPQESVTRLYEERLFAYYGREGYWLIEAGLQTQCT